MINFTSELPLFLASRLPSSELLSTPLHQASCFRSTEIKSWLFELTKFPSCYHFRLFIFPPHFSQLPSREHNRTRHGLSLSWSMLNVEHFMFCSGRDITKPWSEQFSEFSSCQVLSYLLRWDPQLPPDSLIHPSWYFFELIRRSDWCPSNERRPYSRPSPSNLLIIWVQLTSNRASPEQVSRSAKEWSSIKFLWVLLGFLDFLQALASSFEFLWSLLGFLEFLSTFPSCCSVYLYHAEQLYVLILKIGFFIDPTWSNTDELDKLKSKLFEIWRFQVQVGLRWTKFQASGFEQHLKWILNVKLLDWPHAAELLESRIQGQLKSNLVSCGL